MRNSRRTAAKNKFSSQEDEMLRELVKKFGENEWATISSHLIGRNERQCHDRWFYYLSPAVNKEPWTQEEDDLLRKLIDEVGPRWVNISKIMRTRNDIQVKNRWMVLKRRDDADRKYRERMASAMASPQGSPKAEEVSPEPVVVKTKKVDIMPVTNYNETNLFNIDLSDLGFLSENLFTFFE